MNANVYQHFRKDEHPFIDSVGDWLEQVESQYAPYLSDFLDPRQAYIVETLIRQNSDLSFQFYGGYEQAERKRCLIYPDYYEPKEDDFEVELLEIVYPIKFSTLSHGKVLGTLVNTGIKREYFGDIISDNDRWQVFVAKEIANFVETQVEKIGKISVRLEKRKYTEMILPKDDWTHERTTISSLRLDNLISSVYNISRQRSKQLIESGKVKVNWTENTRPDFLVDLLDIVSIRGFGRIQIQELEGKTKKDKFRLLLGVLRK
ncbi:S4 domain-containing protein [Enterococcus sp. 7F3_DIV0205]|uniref:S4 domain-containing protein n=1 Tax=Candidatus Enterococcus palustris TaxID=1834189 RepID=A0AAQ3Y7M1_9ENTE|nr:RNA-binding protein [Enterococcus sp. 7F3_DIV0205]OTN85954.1 S4 domain-containing protein [Enterococcus sp. 7F3_DIV0205]